MADQAVLAPPESLTPPAPVAAVQKEEAGGMVKLDQPTVSKLNGKVDEFIQVILNNDAHSKPFEDKMNLIHNMGNKEIQESARMSNRLLDKPVKSLETGLFNESSNVSKSLTDLRITVEDLDPSKYGDLLSPGNLAKIPILGSLFFNPLRRYFDKYQSSQTNLNAIVNALYRGQDEIKKDNASIEQEKINLWNTMQRIQQYVYVAKKLDEAIEARVAQLEATDPEKARLVKEEMLYYVRQKVQDLLTQQAVNIQGYLALEVIRKNNLELIKGIDRATTTTISALRTAVIVAQALANQKLVLDQINALNETTGNLILSTSKMLGQNTKEIAEMSKNPSIGVEKLQAAFNNIYQTMDMMDTYKLEALDSMKQTVNVLSTEIDKANTYLDRSRGEAATKATSGLNIGTSNDIIL